MRRVCIGIPVRAEPEKLDATIESLSANTMQNVSLLLLPDGPDEAMKAALANYKDVPQSGTDESRGLPACFNRLAAYTDSDILVLFESGAIPGQHWLDYLLSALDADPCNGLAGPSTNRSWNEQCVTSYCRRSPAEVAIQSEKIARQFGPAWRRLKPLHSLGDFCYVVRREVVKAVGAADEGYGLGPCWEMDYNIRAARAGFQGVWACAAYVYRDSLNPQRRHEEAKLFNASKQRYQDKFCEQRLRHDRTDCCFHCRGEDCEYFAPSELIEIHVPLKKTETIEDSTPICFAPNNRKQDPNLSTSQNMPLISCIMPTGNRTDFALQAIRYFQRQDYPAHELIILDDGSDHLSERLPEDSRVRYYHLDSKLSIGAKRNKACELARGSIIAQWDDDDWYAPNRLSAQVAPLLTGVADISGITGTIFFVLDSWEFWRCSQQLHRRLFVEDVHGGTLMYKHNIWAKLARYPDISLAEDATFLRYTIHRGALLQRIPNEDLFIYLRHANNSWAFDCSQYLDPQGWQRIDEPALQAADRAFYAAHSSTAPHASSANSLTNNVEVYSSVYC